MPCLTFNEAISAQNRVFWFQRQDGNHRHVEDKADRSSGNLFRNSRDHLYQTLPEHEGQTTQPAEDGRGESAARHWAKSNSQYQPIHSFCTQLLKNTMITLAHHESRVLKDTEKKRMLDECFADAIR